MDETQTLGLLGERAGILGGIIACARIDGDADRIAMDPSINPRSCSFLMMRTCVQIEAPYDDFQTRACRFIFHLATSRVAARVIVSHPNDALGSLARVLLRGEDAARAAQAMENDDALFRHYAETCVDEWARQGKSTRPMEVELAKPRDRVTRVGYAVD